MKKSFYIAPIKVKYIFNITVLEIHPGLGMRKGEHIETVTMIDYIGKKERVTSKALKFAKILYSAQAVEAKISRYEHI